MGVNQMLLDKTTNFSSDVRSLCEEKQMECIDAVILWCERNKLEVEYAAVLVAKDPVIKSMIQIEAENLNFLKRNARLPI